MQALDDPCHDCNTPLGHRRGKPDPARFSLKPTWDRARADSGSTALSRGYPSPPMSGSPHLPPNAPPQQFVERSQGSHGSFQESMTTSQDARHGIPALQADPRLQQAGVAAGPSGRTSYVGGTQDRNQDKMQYSLPNPHPESSLPRPPLPYPYQSQGHTQHLPPAHQPLHQSNHQQRQYQPMPNFPAPGSSIGVHPGSAPPPSIAYPSLMTGTMASGPMSRPAPEQREGPTQSSPKFQRKTKGHVASACVPCKRAHLRCDAQRPCSRCTSNGKEDACVDVQHKKRGRPRLRDDRESRFDSRFGSFVESHTPIMRRPMSLSGYSSGPTTAGAAVDEGMRRNQPQPYRVLKSQPPEQTVPRFLERASAADANIFPAPAPPLSIYTKPPPEPAAFLTMDFDIAKVSTTFLDALSRAGVQGLRLIDVVAPNDREKVLNHQRQLQDEQRRRDPSYLPPIFGKQEEDRVIQALGFSSEEVGRFSLDREDFLTFVTQDGQQRVYPVRVGLAKQDSIYFVVVRLWMAMRGFPPPTPSPNPRDIVSPSPFYQPLSMPMPVPQPYPQPTPVSATFNPRPSRSDDSSTGYAPRQSAQQQHVAPAPMSAGQSSGLRASFQPLHSPSRSDYPTSQGPYQIPRIESTPDTTTARQHGNSGFHLPPILPQQPPASSRPLEQSYHSLEQPRHPRNDRGRVGIEGLLDQPSSLDRV